MVDLEIKPQSRLALRELVGITLATQRHRLFRSLVTVLVVAVATAFMVNLALDSYLLRKLADSTETRLVEMRQGQDFSATLNQMADLEAYFSRPGPRRILAGMLNQSLHEVVLSDAWSLLVDPGEVVHFNDLLQTLEAPEKLLDVDYVVETARFANRVVLLESTLRELLARGQADEGASFRLVLLLGISLLVCVVGVANALLMAVTERSREIATLKCLGALDGTILLLFVMEASFIGIVGGFTGAALGLFLTLLRLLSGFGIQVIRELSMQSIGVAFIVAVALGMILATAASVYPSLRAARLAPMEAMRVE